MTKIQKIITAVIITLFALFSALGLLRRDENPYQNTGFKIAPETLAVEKPNLAEDIQYKLAEEKTVSFLAAGDIMLSRKVAQTIKQNAPSHGTASTSFPFLKMQDTLLSTDFNFANLESPFDPKFKGTVGGSSLIFSAPSSLVSGLSDFNFKILTLANNHALDKGEEGLKFTKNILNQNDIQTVGVGLNQEEAWQNAVVEKNQIKIAFVAASYSSINDNGATKNNFVARMEDEERLAAAIKKAKKNSDFVVVTMHGGKEYTHKPNPLQTRFARESIKLGADMVIGHHPHWIQEVEKFCPETQEFLAINTAPCKNQKYIFYSLGNFVFDQEWSRETKEGLVLKIHLKKQANYLLKNSENIDAEEMLANVPYTKLDFLELIPVIIENFSTPRPATDQESQEILSKIGVNEKILR